ncbi:TcpQ domain-containing protein [Castellaniella sp. GW247-6E4]|uniref:TcpQ domain-containing protein n=1 Tax=Castellaniella sp. GW247-6E4 TaxID=3140380 RepID=UPI0033147E2B
MSRFIVLAAASVLLAGCAQTSPWAWLDSQGRRPVDQAPGRFSFDWRIDGEPSLAPLQVFDDGERIWLQYPAGQAAPALFERTGRGDRLLLPTRRGDYLIVEGVPAHLVMRGGHLQAEAQRDEQAAPEVLPPAAPASTEGSAASAALPTDAPAPLAAQDVALAFPAPAPPPLPRRVPTAPPPVPPPAPPPVASPMFQAGPADVNIRKALGRWARDAGWVFEAEHWAVDVDIPLAGSAAFGDAFRPAVRALLAATELGERPLQPCFYANRVLRVVPLAQRCDRTAGTGRPS